MSFDLSSPTIWVQMMAWCIWRTASTYWSIGEESRIDSLRWHRPIVYRLGQPQWRWYAICSRRLMSVMNFRRTVICGLFDRARRLATYLSGSTRTSIKQKQCNISSVLRPSRFRCLSRSVRLPSQLWENSRIQRLIQQRHLPQTPRSRVKLKVIPAITYFSNSYL